MRRGEVPFVAVRVGRSADPREVLGLARDLRIPPAHALGIVILWEEFILEVGDALTGRVKGYAADHIAAKLGWTGPVKKLLDALGRAGLVKRQRGVWFHPYWRHSITGQYAIDRAELRAHWREKKRRQRGSDGDAAGDGTSEMENGVLETSPGTSGGQAGDVPPSSSGKTHIDQFINGHARFARGAGPPDPPQAGGTVGSARWEWVYDHHQRPMNPGACIRYLELMSEDEWKLFQWVSTPPAAGGPRSSSRKKRVLEQDSHKILATQAYLQFLPEWREKLRREASPAAAKGAPRAAPPTPKPDEAAQLAAKGVKFLLEQLADGDLSDDYKAKVRDRWLKSHPGERPPWEEETPGTA